MKCPVLFWIALLFNSVVSSQISDGGLPIVNPTLSNDRMDVRIMDDIPLADLMAEDAINDRHGNQAWRFAYPFDVSINMENAGTWTRQVNGSNIWRLKIISPYATSINFIFDEFYIPAGGKLYIYNESKTEILGAFTANNNKAHKIFATALILDDHAILQYESNPRNNEDPILSIKQVSHGYRGFVAPIYARGLNDSGSCQVNINCSEGDNWQDEKRGVARILIGGTLTCSGSLVNNASSDNTPYFLTANHCIGSLDAVDNPDPDISATYVFYFNYERPSCTNSGNTPIETVNGSTLLANDSPSDFALFLLDDNPSDNYNVTFNGLNGTNNIGIGGVGIHHPAFDAKKIATHSMAPLDTDYPGSPDSSHWEVNWDATINGHSVTE